jgi:dimethylhistidine N-methyltransferase
LLTTPERLNPAPAAGGLSLHDYAPTPVNFLDAVVEGLSGGAKAIPCRFLYDERGSQLFDLICEQPEYYPTRTELQILRRHAGEIAAMAGPGVELIELGSGSSHKVKLLLDAFERPAAYVPIDISREHLLAAARRVAAERPALEVRAVCADYGQPFDLPVGKGRRVAFFPGSTIGNFEKAEARAFMADWARRLGAGAGMIVGVDLKKPAEVLDRAYDDAAGVTAAFSLNLLARANRELGTDFDLGGFRHVARYSEAAGCVEIHLKSLKAQTVRAGGRAFSFGEGERLHVENSHKYGTGEFAALTEAAGFRWEACWTDPQDLFSVHFLSVPAANA